MVNCKVVERCYVNSKNSFVMLIAFAIAYVVKDFLLLLN